MKDIEEFYIEGVEQEGENFLEGLKNGRSLAELEKEYSKKVKEIRKIYEKSFKKELNKEKLVLIKSTKTSGLQKHREEKFEPTKFNLEKTQIEREKIKISIGAYNFRRKLKNLIQKITPNRLIFLHYKLIKNVKYLLKKIGGILEKIWKKCFEKVLNILRSIKSEIFKLNSILIEGINKLKRKKNKKEDGEKKDIGKQNK